MLRESQIVHEVGDFWVFDSRHSYDVMRNVGTHSECDSSYSHSSDGKELAIYRANYLACFKQGRHTDIKLTGKFETENLTCRCGFSIPF